MRFRDFLIILCVMACPAAMRGAEPERVERLYRNWTTRDGLPNDRVKAMARTRDGFIWLGTDGGLAKFDGMRFENYGIREGSGEVASDQLLATRSVMASLWVATTGHGISKILNGRVERTYTTEDGVPAVAVSMEEDAEGRVWACGSGWVARLEGGRFINVQSPPDAIERYNSTLFRDRSGTLWGLLKARGSPVGREKVGTCRIRGFRRPMQSPKIRR